MNQYQYEVGDIVKLKKPHLWASDDGNTQACGKEYKRLAEAGIKCM